jgi:hypothetical protein
MHFPEIFRNRPQLPPVQGAKRSPKMAKPPKSTKHSDIDGVHRDEKPNVESAVEAGQDHKDLALAARENAARPDYSGDVKNRDDRSA